MVHVHRSEKRLAVEGPPVRSLCQRVCTHTTMGLHGSLSVHTSVFPRYQSQGPIKDFDALRHIGRSWTLEVGNMRGRSGMTT
ncbi:hypothetical protein PpBr36_07580 [Pyricularia pennisetigena]|uniref:hypothetical protein n=1 Tax=Pyricularia pennisetigena TaxID=1578925 RepID=UPI00114EAE5B|nr:hypothetical protein PpBr36_07580 [Pyricularia pennisetigena]TLS25172.1 hypothetical protein PpBr36_07580 [Pyricularia pennisetigena]